MSKESENRRIAQSAVHMGMSQKFFINALRDTDTWISREHARQTYNDEKRRYNNDIALQKSDTIDYDNLNESHTEIVSKYSFKVKIGDEYQTGTGFNLDEHGNKRPVYVTVRSNKKLSRSQILRKARSAYRGNSQHYGQVKGRASIVSGLRRKG